MKLSRIPLSRIPLSRIPLSRIPLGRIPKTCALALLRGYKWAISPLLPPSCRYTPTCSDYAVEAIELHGVLKGSALALWRLLRCHPFVRGGYDPVPHEHLSSSSSSAAGEHSAHA